MIDSIVRFLENKNQQSINERLRTFLVIGLILLVAGCGVLLSPEAKAKSGGLKVYVHISGGGGNVCVRTASEDAGCKSLGGPGTAEFEFSPDAVAVGQKFTACVDQTCATGTNSAAKKPGNVYLSSDRGVSSNIATPQPQLQQQQSPPLQTTRRINWKGMCSAVQSALYSSCDTLVNSDGSLSLEGERAWICIRNGGSLALGAMALGVSPTATIAGLSSLSNPTSCGNIVNFNILPSIPNLKTIINLIPSTIGSNTVSR
jgi:hypothetical protein